MHVYLVSLLVFANNDNIKQTGMQMFFKFSHSWHLTLSQENFLQMIHDCVSLPISLVAADSVFPLLINLFFNSVNFSELYIQSTIVSISYPILPIFTNPSAKTKSYISVSVLAFRFFQHPSATKDIFPQHILNTSLQNYQSIYDS